MQRVASSNILMLIEFTGFATWVRAAHNNVNETAKWTGPGSQIAGRLLLVLR